MPVARPFRFHTSIGAVASAAEFVARVRHIEALGYTSIGTGDHFEMPLAPIPALMAAAMATTTLRLQTVFDNDFRHPALLAKEAATIDLLTGGRLQLGIGAGWMKSEYDLVGIPFDPPGVRVSRLEEAVQIIKGLWDDGPVTFAGRYYTVTGLEGSPKPVQHPHLPIFMGGGGKRLLSFAAREADIIGIMGLALPGGGLDIAGITEAALAEKVGWVRAAAGERFEQIQLAILVWSVVVTDDRQAAAERIASARGLSVEQILASAQFLIGSIDQIVERLLALRERHGLSYITVTPQDSEVFAPVVARLAGR